MIRLTPSHTHTTDWVRDVGPAGWLSTGSATCWPSTTSSVERISVLDQRVRGPLYCMLRAVSQVHRVPVQWKRTAFRTQVLVHCQPFSSGGNGVPFGTARWVVALGIIPFGYFVGLSSREGNDEKAVHDAKVEQEVQKRLQGKIASHKLQQLLARNEALLSTSVPNPAAAKEQLLDEIKRQRIFVDEFKEK